MVDASMEIIETIEDNSACPRLEQMRGRRRALENRSVGREAARQCDDTADGRDRVGKTLDDIAIDEARLILQPLRKRPASDVPGRQVQYGFQLPQDGTKATGGVEILHVAVADGLQVDEHRGFVGNTIDLLPRDPVSYPAGDRSKVNDRVRRSSQP